MILTLIAINLLAWLTLSLLTREPTYLIIVNIWLACGAVYFIIREGKKI